MNLEQMLLVSQLVPKDSIAARVDISPAWSGAGLFTRHLHHLGFR
jgi:hypothetical protein